MSVSIPLLVSFALALLLLTSRSPNGVCAVSIDPGDSVVLGYILGNLTGGIFPTQWSATNISNACDWRGVECHPDGHIKKLKISPDFNLSQKTGFINSTLPAAIGLLPNMMFLDIIDAGFYGNLPSEIFTPTIVNINAGTNFFTGAFPKAIVNATQLNYISIYENIFTSLPVPEILQYLAKSQAPRSTDFVFSRNSLNCSSFHPGFFTKKDELDPICDVSFNLLPPDSNGNVCGYPQIPEGGYVAGCRLRPVVQTSFTPRPLPATPWIIKSDKMQVEIQGTRLTFYGIMRNGTVYRDEFVAVDLYGIGQTVTELTNHLVDEAPLVQFSSVREISSGVWNISSNIYQMAGNNRVTFSVIAELNTPEGGVKFSVEYKGLNISRRAPPISLSLPVQVLIRAPIASSAEVLRCTSFALADAYTPDGIGCRSNTTTVSFKAEINSVRLEVRSQRTQMSFETPFSFTDLKNNITNSARDSLRDSPLKFRTP